MHRRGSESLKLLTPVLAAERLSAETMNGLPRPASLMNSASVPDDSRLRAVQSDIPQPLLQEEDKGDQDRMQISRSLTFTPAEVSDICHLDLYTCPPISILPSAYGCPPFHVWQNLHTGERMLRPAYNPVTSGSEDVTYILSPLEAFSSDHADVLIPKKQRISWTGRLEEAFQEIVLQLDKEATPNTIKKMLHGSGFTNVTREHVSSHLQKYKKRKKPQPPKHSKQTKKEQV